MGYEILLFVPLIWFLNAVIIHYSNRLRIKYLMLIVTVLFTFFYCFIKPGPLWIKKKFPYVYWCGSTPKKQVQNMERKIKKFMNKIGFEFID